MEVSRKETEVPVIYVSQGNVISNLFSDISLVTMPKLVVVHRRVSL